MISDVPEPCMPRCVGCFTQEMSRFRRKVPSQESECLQEALTGIDVCTRSDLRNENEIMRPGSRGPRADRVIHFARVRHTALISRAQHLSLVDSRRVRELGRNVSQDLGGPPALDPQRTDMESKVQKESPGYLGTHLVTPHLALSTCCVTTARNSLLKGPSQRNEKEKDPSE